MRKQDQVIEFLKSRKCVELESRSGKYRKLSRTQDDQFYFVGKAGAVRVGKNISDSFSVTKAVTHLMKIREDTK